MATRMLACKRSPWPRLACSAALSLVASSMVVTAASAQRAPSWASDGLMLARACDPSPYGKALAAQLTKGGDRTPPPASDPASAPGRLLARAEAKPSDAVARLELARCFVSRSEFAVAREHVARAIEIIRQARAASPPVDPAAPAPVKKSGPAPEYPAKLGKNVNGLTGLVFLEVDVDAQGKVGKAKVVGSIPEFDAEALNAVKQWTFTPAMVSAQPVASTTTVILKFGVATDQDVTDAIDIARFFYMQKKYGNAEAALAQVNNAFTRVEMLARSREERKAEAQRHGGLIQPGWWGAGAYYPEGDISMPVPTFRPTPSYTPGAMAQKIAGRIELDAIFRADGTVGDVVVVDSLDRVYGLDASAIAAAKAWTFTPAHDPGGKPVPVLITLIFDLRLH